MTATDAASIKSKRIVYLVSATVTLLVLGLIYAWSIFATPIGKEYAAYRPLLGSVFQVSMFAFCVSALFGAQLLKRTSAKLTVIVAAVLLGVGFVLTALLADLGVWVLFVCYGILAASGCGIAYNAIISLVNPWFPDKVGLASGIMMMGFGLASLIFGSLANAMIGVMGWQNVFYCIAATGVVVMVLMVCVVKPAPAEVAHVITGKAAPASAAGTPKVSPTQEQGILTTKVFWLYSLWATIVIACGLTLIGTARQGAEALRWDTTFAATLVGLVSTMNGVARVVNGAIFDRVGLIPVMVLGSVIAIVTMVGLAFSFLATLPAVYVAAAILVAFPYGGVPVMAAAYARQRYRARDFAMNLGIANCNIATAALLNLVITAIVGPISASEAAKTAPVIYGVLAVLAVAALGFTFLFGKVYKADLARIAEELR